MNKSIAATFAMATLALPIALFAPHGTAKDNPKSGVIAAGDIKWADVPGFPGVQMAVLGGNSAKGPHHSMLKFAGGFSAPLHHHTADHYATVVAGTVVLVIDGVENKLPAGSYFAFTGKAKHETRCAAGAECVIAVDARGAWDVLVEGAKPAAKKK